VKPPGNGPWVKMLHFVALLVVVVVMLTALGCTAAGQETTPKEETTPGEQTTTGNTVAPLVPQDNDVGDSDKHILRCQLEEASKDNGGGTKQGQFVDEVYREAEERGVDPEQVLSERGYDCSWSALQKSGGKG
jgi:hypothetical protein